MISQTAADLFVDEDADLQLKTGSNLIDAGKDIAGFSDDWEGTARTSTKWDIGFHEFGDLAAGNRRRRFLIAGAA